MTPLRVSVKLLNPIAGDELPRLDALVLGEVIEMTNAPQIVRVGRDTPCPPAFEFPVPIEVAEINGHRIARCSSPIGMTPKWEGIEYIHKRFAADAVDLLHPDCLGVVQTKRGYFKGERLPLRSRLIPEIAWFCVGDAETLQAILGRVKTIGKKRAHGNAVVESWCVEPVEHDQSWFAESPWGSVLMRELPHGPSLPANLCGHRLDFGACAPPYWHRARYIQRVSPV
mgnify:CR=1 FL=1